MEIKWRSHFYDWKVASAEDGYPFTKQEYIAFNKGIQFIKYDPDVINANPPLISKSFVDVFPGIKYFQFPRISKYRPFPLRILYSKKLGNFHELKGTNKPIYEVMRYLQFQDAFSTKGIYDEEKAKQWALTSLMKYFVFFFDNVVGKHGRFELINCQSTRTSPVDQLIDRINTFYKIQQNPEDKKNAVLNEYMNIYASLGIHFDESILKLRLIEAAKAFMDKTVAEFTPPINTEMSWKLSNFPMIFKASLFTASAICNLNEGEQFGLVSLDDEIHYEIKLSKDVDDIDIDLIAGDTSKKIDGKLYLMSDFPFFG